MKTFKIDVTKINEIANENTREAVSDEMFELIWDKIYYIRFDGMMIFPTFEAFFEAMRFGVTEFYFTTHTIEDTDNFISNNKYLVSIMEVVDRDEEIEKRKNKTTRSKVAIERYEKFNLDDEDLSAIKDMSQSGSFGFHSIMETFDIDYETLRMIEEDNSIEIIEDDYTIQDEYNDMVEGVNEFKPELDIEYADKEVEGKQYTLLAKVYDTILKDMGGSMYTNVPWDENPPNEVVPKISRAEDGSGMTVQFWEDGEVVHLDFTNKTEDEKYWMYIETLSKLAMSK